MFRISCTALTACSTSGNWAIATLVGSSGVRRSVARVNLVSIVQAKSVCPGISPSVTIPSVPSAPMNSLVASNPADDFLALLRVFMTSPFGSTAV